MIVNELHIILLKKDLTLKLRVLIALFCIFDYIARRDALGFLFIGICGLKYVCLWFILTFLCKLIRLI